MMTDVDMAELILAFPIVQELSSDTRDVLMAESYQFRASDAETVFDLSGQCVGFAVLMKGTIRMLRRVGDHKSVLFYRLAPGNVCVVTVSALLSESSYPACGVAEGDVRGYWISQDLFHRAMHESIAFRTYVITALAQRFNEVLLLVEQVAFKRLDQRLAASLLERGDLIEVSHQRLAEDLGSAREVVSRTLEEFEGRGILTLARQRIHVIQRAALEEMVKDA